MAKIPLLEIRGLRKSFNGVEVLHSVDLTLEKGKVTALVGENGKMIIQIIIKSGH